MHFFVAVLSVVAIAGCGKTSQEKAKDTAESAVNEFNTSTNEIVKMGLPSASWSEEKLTRYEGLLNSSESSLNRVEAQNGRDGVVVYGTSSIPEMRSALSKLRSAVRTARTDKAEAERRKQFDDLVSGTYDKYRNYEASIERAGTPSPTWSNEQIDQYEADLIGFETTVESLVNYGYGHLDRYDADKAIKSVKEKRALLNDIRKAKASKPAA